MSPLMAFLVFGGWFILAGLVAVAVGAVLRFDPNDPPLLLRFDGRPLGASLDEHAHERLTLEAATEASAAYLYAEREAMEWDYVLSLPARDHR